MLLFWVALTGIGNFQNGPHEQPSSLSTLPWFKNAAAASGNQFLKKAFVTIVSEDLFYIYIYTYCMYFWLFSYPVFLVHCIPQQEMTTITTNPTNTKVSTNPKLRSYAATLHLGLTGDSGVLMRGKPMVVPQPSPLKVTDTNTPLKLRVTPDPLLKRPKNTWRWLQLSLSYLLWGALPKLCCGDVL